MAVRQHDEQSSNAATSNAATSNAAKSAAHRNVESVAVRMLGHREHGRREIVRKLRAKGHPAQVVEEVVARLVELELVSDVRFAEAFVRSRLRRGKGPLRIRADMRQRGIDDPLVDDVLTETGEFWRRQAEQARQKRFGEALPQERSSWSRQARFLSQRGFPADVIYRVLGEIHG
jgi:regulatory protein